MRGAWASSAGLCLALGTSLVVERSSPVASQDQGHTLIMVLNENQTLSVSENFLWDMSNKYMK